MKIIGAGLAGLIAAYAFPRAHVYEASPSPSQNHRALLRFRTDAVSRLTGIPFKKVLVRKGIFSDGKFVQPNIALANQYSEKCLGRIEGDRSIWRLDPVERFIAPDDFYGQLLLALAGRVSFDSPHDFRLKEQVISTAPLPVVLEQLDMVPPVDLAREPIMVERFKVPDCDTYQTIYFPDRDTSIYRASITGDTMIVEHAGGEPFGMDNEELIEEAFGIPFVGSLVPMGKVEQRYGKIATIDATIRKEILYRLTRDFNIYSLGRFATWRNILLCDLMNDIDVIRKMLRASEYDARLHTIYLERKAK